MEALVLTMQQNYDEINVLHDHANICSNPEHCDTVACSSEVQIIDVLSTNVKRQWRFTAQT